MITKSFLFAFLISTFFLLAGVLYYFLHLAFCENLQCFETVKKEVMIEVKVSITLFIVIFVCKLIYDKRQLLKE